VLGCFEGIKGCYLLLVLTKLLDELPAYKFIIIQNPPALPLIIAALCVNILRTIRSCFGSGETPAVVCLDWHNLGFSMYAQMLAEKQSLLRTSALKTLIFISKTLEHFLSQFVHQHLCVSHAMRLWLIDNFSISPDTISVLYDKPPVHFRTSSNHNADVNLQYRHQLLSKLNLCPEVLFAEDGSSDCTIQTRKCKGGSKVELVPYQVLASNSTQKRQSPRSKKGEEDCCPDRRTILILSSTSWTEDEDFSILVDAMVLLDTRITELVKQLPDYKIPRVVVAVTGKGPLKAEYEERFKHLNSCVLQCVRFTTLWLEAADYPKFVGYADLGICLHTSTSGLDLPMKVLDMLGAEVPVLAVSYPTLSELVKHHENGIIFSTPLECAQAIFELFYRRFDNTLGLSDSVCGGPSLPPLEAFKSETRKIGNWDDNWNNVLGPTVQKYFCVS